MAYFAWHKLISAKPKFEFDSGCTAICCCVTPPTGCGLCPGAPLVFPPACASPDGSPQTSTFNGPLPITRSDHSTCCTECTWSINRCVEFAPGLPSVCYTIASGTYEWLCFGYIGYHDENLNYTWLRANYDGINCNGLNYACQNTNPGPLSSKLTLGIDDSGTANYYYKIPNEDDYIASPGTYRLQDPAHTYGRTFRYYRTPLQTNEVPENFYESSVCLRLKIPSTVPTRTIVLSGYNRYNYTGYLSGDPAITSPNRGGDPPLPRPIPKIVHDPGTSGLSQMEGSLGRAFPLSDDVLTFPLWGGATGYTSQDPSECVDCFDYFATPLPEGERRNYCKGDNCLKVQSHDVTGHYLSMVATNLTGHYHSFSGFNPYVKFFEASIDYYPEDFDPVWSAYNNGIGLPTCSLYSLAWSLYDRSWRLLTDTDVVSAVDGSEQGIYNQVPTQFANVRNKLNSLLSDDPRNLTGPYGESVVTYWFDQLNQAIVDFYAAYSTETGVMLPTHFNQSGGGGVPKTLFGAFTTPKVILWDRAAFLNASTNADRWKSLYIPGSGNILFDSGCTHTNNNWKAFQFYVDEGSHDMAWGSTHAATVLQFRVCDASQDQILNETCISIDRVAPADSGNYFCEMCGTSGDDFGMDFETDCTLHTAPPEIRGDFTVGTDYRS